MQKPTNPQKNINIRIDLSIFEKIQRIAMRESRSTGKQIAHWVRQAVERDESTTVRISNSLDIIS